MVTNEVRTAHEPDVLNPNCPTRLVLDRIGDRWTVLVVLLLRDGPVRFTALRTALGGVAPKVLTQTLKAMARDGLVTRTVYAEVPPKVTYELTELGQSLRAPIEAVATWAESNVSSIMAAREAASAG